MPILKKLQKSHSLKNIVVLDIKSSKIEIDKAFDKYSLPLTRFYEFPKLIKELRSLFSKIITKYEIQTAIISCDDSFHETYLDLCFKYKLHVLMEKPLFTSDYSTVSENKSKELMIKYQRVLRLYEKAKKEVPDLVFSIITQRRFHPAFQYILNEVEKVYSLTNCPVTSSSFYHSDGQWRMPEEIIAESYHGFNRGIGKCSHSGYHFFDLLSLVMNVSKEDKKPDHVSVNSSFVRPLDFFKQISTDDYEKLFPKYNLQKQEFYDKQVKEFGEIDANIVCNFYRENKKVSFSNVQLLHNGFSNRSWFESKKDLYKGNGRLRHEHHIINQGPFQSIHFHSLQSDETSNSKLSSSQSVGGELHFEIFLFKNKKILGDEFNQFEVKSFSDFPLPKSNNYAPRGHQEFSKFLCIQNFFDACDGKTKDISDFRTHYHAHLLYYLANLSGAKEYAGKNNLVKEKW